MSTKIGELVGSGKEALDPKVSDEDKSLGQRAFAGGLKGGMQGYAQQQQQPRQGGGSQIQVAQAPQVQTNYDPNYLLKLQQMKQGNGFYGGY